MKSGYRVHTRLLPHRPLQGKISLSPHAAGIYGGLRVASGIPVSVPETGETRERGQEDEYSEREARGYESLYCTPSVSLRQVFTVGLLCKSRYRQDQGDYPEDDREGREVFSLCCHLGFLVHEREQDLWGIFFYQSWNTDNNCLFFTKKSL
jgi:hypothetical protein